jgi:sugar lactone lactonase YvrE
LRSYRNLGAILAGLLFLGYLLAWPVPIDPVTWRAPDDPGLVGSFSPNERLAGIQTIDLGDVNGHEDIAKGWDGALYATTHDGFILRIEPDTATVTRFAEVSGRPLGIEAAGDGSLLVANAYLGIQQVLQDRTVLQLLHSIDGQPIIYADDLAVTSSGLIYFSEASTKFGARAWGGTYEASLLDIMEHGGHGRIVEFDRTSGATRVVIDGLDFANGVVLTEDESALLVAETGSYRILRHWLHGPHAGKTEILIDNLPGFPDNINRGNDGRFWIGLVAPRNSLLDRLSDKPTLRKIVQRLPALLRPSAEDSSHVIAIDVDGGVIASLQDPSALYPTTTGVCETNEYLYITRLFGNELPFISNPFAAE